MPHNLRKLLTLSLSSALLFSVARSQEQTPSSFPPLYLGTAWYPEQWPESRWDADLTLMERAHVRFVRITEFAWSSMEPTEGRYAFDWIDHAIAAAAKHHIYVVLGTPGATPPAWRTQKYPEVLRIKEDGRRDEHGNSEQFNFANPKYRELTRGITEKMAQRYGHNPNVIGWQNRQRVRQRVLRPRRAKAVSGLVHGPLQDSRQPQRPPGPPPIGASPTATGRRSPFRRSTATPAFCLAGSAS